MDSVRNSVSISAVVPCYNCMETLRRAVDSLVDQTVKLNEIILVDDGSKDDTAKLCDEYSAKYDYVKIIHKKNGGLVSAWKAGVEAASGDYMVFCDADDYVDRDLVGKVMPALDEYFPDLVVYGHILEYSNGDKIPAISKLEPGFYDIDSIKQNVLPVFFSDGSMQSGVMSSSRCDKIFKRAILNKIMDDICDCIDLGEDDVTCFSYILNSESMYVFPDFTPYHYLRNDTSMIGAYDTQAFLKIEKLYDELEKIAVKYEYAYPEQLKLNYLSTMILFMKKEICRNPDGYRSVRNNLIHAMSSNRFINEVDIGLIQKYSFMSKIFAMILIKRWYFLTYIITLFFDRLRGRNV